MCRATTTTFDLPPRPPNSLVENPVQPRRFVLTTKAPYTNLVSWMHVNFQLHDGEPHIIVPGAARSVIGALPGLSVF